MDVNITFRLDADIKEQMSDICQELGMTTSTAFNLFARAFVRTKGMPFAVTVRAPTEDKAISQEQMLADAGQTLAEFESDYVRMAK